MRTKRLGFTLIELLVVVGIISILASIAVPNFLEAQTRAKVSRAQTDMRTVSVALESYVLDHNHYPIVADVKGEPIVPYTLTTSYILGTRLHPCITTPIAYITTRPIDPFCESRTDPRTYYYHTYDYSIALRGLFGAWYWEDYIADLNGQGRSFTAYAVVSNGPDLDHDLLSRPDT